MKKSKLGAKSYFFQKVGFRNAKFRLKLGAISYKLCENSILSTKNWPLLAQTRRSKIVLAIPSILSTDRGTAEQMFLSIRFLRNLHQSGFLIFNKKSHGTRPKSWKCRAATFSLIFGQKLRCLWVCGKNPANLNMPKMPKMAKKWSEAPSLILTWLRNF